VKNNNDELINVSNLVNVQHNNDELTKNLKPQSGIVIGRQPSNPICEI